MYYLYPKIHRAYAEKLIEERSNQDIAELSQISDASHPLAFYSPTGGNRIPSDILESLQKSIKDCAEKHGYPNLVNDEMSRSFDIECGIICFEKMYLHPSEASDVEVWAFMTCVLLPEVVNEVSRDKNCRKFIGTIETKEKSFEEIMEEIIFIRQIALKNPYYYILNS